MMHNIEIVDCMSSLVLKKKNILFAVIVWNNSFLYFDNILLLYFLNKFSFAGVFSVSFPYNFTGKSLIICLT